MKITQRWGDRFVPACLSSEYPSLVGSKAKFIEQWYKAPEEGGDPEGCPGVSKSRDFYEHVGGLF